jgi:uncharacterized protein YndB with AHSA1/START domain
MRGPDAAESWGKATYREVVAPERIVYVDVFSDADGNAAPGMPEVIVTVEFAEVDGGSKITSTSEFATKGDLESLLEMGVVEGITETWDRLEEYLALA